VAFNAPIKRNEGVKPLRGTEKVAALLLAMGRELSSGVLKEFDPDEIKIVTRAAADLKPISTPELEAIIEEFAQNFSTGPNIFGTVGELEKLLTGVLPPDQVSDIIRTSWATRTNRSGKESHRSLRAFWPIIS
jgi:flagellar motor switch protein FliG